MTRRIETGGLDDPGVVALLREHLEEMRAVTPPGSVHALDLDALRRPEIRFWTARDDDGVVVGCVALQRLTDEHVELKSMRTATGHIGTGTGTSLLQRVLSAAREDGAHRISLETGSGEFFAPARRLYARHGFVACPPFADYQPDPLSSFMTRDL